MRQRRGGRVHGPLEVDVDHLLDLLRIELEERPVGAHARVCDHDLQRAEVLDDLVARTRDRDPVADVADDAESSVEPEIAAVPRQHPDRGSRLVKPVRDRRADATACARDERHLAVQFHRALLLLMSARAYAEGIRWGPRWSSPVPRRRAMRRALPTALVSVSMS